MVIGRRNLERIEAARADDPLQYHGLADWLHANYRQVSEAPRGDVWILTEPTEDPQARPAG